MATPEEIALAYQRGQKGIILGTVAAVLALWRRLDEDNLTRSWTAGIGPSLIEAVTQAQLAAAAAAPTYLEELAAAQGVLADMSALVPSTLSGVASDGRPLESLLYQPIILLKRLLSAGQWPEDAMRQATNFMALLAATQVADAGRGAVNVGITATRQWVTYVRVVNLPACSRCIILAGREYSWSTGFQRHPSCDCSMIPRRAGDAPPATPEQLFAQMSSEEQDRRFGKAGAEALRLGGDMGQIVNARRGMQTAGGRLVTTEGTTRRGVAGRRMGSDSRRRSAIRPMPEQILADANGDRDLAIQLLERNGFLDASSTRRFAAAQGRTMQASAPTP
ncbi:VG15 protein [Streptosporangium vulgare]|uniref:MuF-like minor capsid protein n=1 Tax=Streptosporangium vulgare TaxID=46190 RepID=A0ABV5TQD6_9ACTN